MCKAGLTALTLERRDDSFYVALDMHFVCESVKDDASHIFTPILANEDSHIELPTMLIAGKKRYWAFRLALWGLGNNTLRHYRIMKILKAVNCTSINYLYRVKLDYQDWMEDAKVRLA